MNQETMTPNNKGQSKKTPTKSTSNELKSSIKVTFETIKNSDKDNVQKLEAFAASCKELLRAQRINKKSSCKNIILEKLYELNTDQAYPTMNTSPQKGKRFSKNQAKTKRNDAKTLAEVLLNKYIGIDFFQLELKNDNEESANENLNSAKIGGPAINETTSPSTIHEELTSEFLTTQLSYKSFCDDVSFNIGLVMLATSAVLVASSYGAFPMMTAVIITSATNFVTNNLVQYYNTKKLEDIIVNKPSYLRSLIISNLIILTGNTLAIAALVYASQGVLPVIAAGLMVATLYIAFEYTKFKGHANIQVNQPPKSETTMPNDENKSPKDFFNSVSSLFSGAPNDHENRDYENNHDPNI